MIYNQLWFLNTDKVRTRVFLELNLHKKFSEYFHFCLKINHVVLMMNHPAAVAEALFASVFCFDKTFFHVALKNITVTLLHS